MQYSFNNKIYNVVLKISKRVKYAKIGFDEFDNIIVISNKNITQNNIKQLLDNNTNLLFKCLNRPKRPKLSDEFTYIHNEKFFIKFKSDNKESLDIDFDNKIINITSKQKDVEKIKTIIETRIKNLLQNIIKKYLEENFSKIAKQFKDIEYKEISLAVKKVKTYYGKCTPNKNSIIFSYKLAKLEPKYIDYVIYHELAHFRYLNHQKEFYIYLEQKLKGSFQLDRNLKRIKFLDIY